MEEHSLSYKFMNLFSGITFNVLPKQNKTQHVLSNTSIDTTKRDLNKMLANAKKDLSKAKKLYKFNKISSDELFEWEFRVTEIMADIDKINDINSDI